MNKNRKNMLYMTSAAWKLEDLTGGTAIPESEFRKENIFHREFKNFGRLDNMSKSVCAAIALILHQKKLYPSDKKLNIPIFFGLNEGPISSDYAYYSDFLKFGGTAGRANLFVYTLPSSPLGEASVHFGLTGNLLFVNADNTLSSICQMIINNQERDLPKFYIAGVGEVNGDKTNALFMLFEKNRTNNSSALNIEEVAQLSYLDLNDLKSKFT